MNRRRAVVIANEIRMKRSQHRGTFLVVEGRDDRLFMERFTCNETCKIVVAEGKENVEEVITILDQDNFGGVLGIVDADFDRIQCIKRASSNIVMPAYHDLETMLICSPALDRVLNEYASQTKIRDAKMDILEELIDKALPVAYLRLISLRERLELRFDGLIYSSWVNINTWAINIRTLVEEVKNKSQRHDLSSQLLTAAMKEVQLEKPHAREMCTGADLIEILAIGLRRVLGTNQQSSVNGINLRRSLRLAYSDGEFRKSSLGKDIRKWESKGLGRILRTCKKMGD